MANQVYDPERSPDDSPSRSEGLEKKFGTGGGREQQAREEETLRRAGVSEEALQRRRQQTGYNPNELRSAESGRSPSSAGGSNFRFNPSGDEGSGGQSSSAESPGNLREAEGSTSSSQSSQSSQGGFFSRGDDKQSPLQRFRGKVSGLSSTNKLLIGAGFSGGFGVLIIIILLILFLGNYKIVDFAEHVAAYQFARNTSQMSDDANAITAEKVGVDSADSGIYNSLKGRLSTATGPLSEAWSKLDKYQPNKIIQNFSDDGVMQFNYESGTLGRQVLKSITINGREIAIQNTPIKDKLIPGYKLVGDAKVADSFAPELSSALKANDIGPITRARVASQIRGDLDISLTAWTIGKYAGKSEAAADAQQEQDAYKVAEGTDDPVSGPDKTVNDATDEARQAEDNAVQDPDKIAEIVKSGGELPQDLIDSINKSFTTNMFSSFESIIESAVGFVNPIYKYSVPLCLIYDGSLQNSGGTMDAQTQQLERTGVYTQTMSAQEKDGSATTGEAVGAGDWKLADITQSNAEKRASGIPVDTSNYPSTEASPTGEYSIANYGLGSTLGNIVNEGAGPFCKIATNLWGGIGLGVAGILFAPGVGTETDAAADAAGQTLGDQVVGKISTTFGSQAGRVAGNTVNAGDELFSWKTVRTLGLIGAGTIVAKTLVMSQNSSTHNSLGTGAPYANDSDSGLNIYANQDNQQQFYGAPMTDENLGADNAANTRFLSEQESKESVFNRYASLSNPDSLLSRFALTAGSYLSTSSLHSLPSLAGAILNPIRSLGSALSPLINRTSFADATITSANTYYGNIQFGYTPAEKALMKNDPSYGMLENAKILTDSGNSDAIAAKYGKCFDGSESIGDMLANGDIQRDDNGDVIADKGLCSPDNLTFTNNEFGSQMVFRWRVFNNYNNAMDQLGQMQVITASDDSGGGGGVTDTDCASASGDAAILCEAQKYQGIYYLSAGGHQSYPVFTRGCSSSVLASAASSSTAGSPGPCGTDCSGLVSVAVDGAFGQNFQWSVSDANGEMVGTGSQYWQKIPIDQAQPGDIVTHPVVPDDPSGHVEIVQTNSGGKFITFGSHNTGEKTGPITWGSSPSASDFTAAYHWTGPGSGGS